MIRAVLTGGPLHGEAVPWTDREHSQRFAVPLVAPVTIRKPGRHEAPSSTSSKVVYVEYRYTNVLRWDVEPIVGFSGLANTIRAEFVGYHS